MQKIGDFWVRKIHQSWFVVWFSVGVVVGVILGTAFRINYFASGWFIMLSGVLFVICLVRPLLLYGVLAVLAGFLVSFVRVAEELSGEKYIRQFYGVSVMVVGEIGGDPETDEAQTKIKLVNLRFGGGCKNGQMGDGEKSCIMSRGSIYVTLQKNEDLKWGDMVALSGRMSEGFGTYAGYMYKPRIMWWARPEPRPWIMSVRDWFAGRVEQMIGGTEAKLGLSYLVGMKTGLPDELKENLRTVGLTHIVVASGAHLAILVGVARKLFGKISRFAGFLFSVIFILVFMMLVGWTPSILRAGVMTILTLISWYVGRKITSWRMILMVAAATLIINPMFIINIGWLLSFASYAGITILMPKLAKVFYGEQKPGFVGGTILMTVSATLMTLPIILYYYGQVSLISVMANLLILPTLSIAMGFTFLTGVVAGIPGVNLIAAWCATRILEFHIVVVDFFGGMVQFLVKIEPYQMWVFLIYVVIATILAFGNLLKKKKNVVKLNYHE